MTPAGLNAIEARANDDGTDLRFTAPWVKRDVSALVAEIRRLQSAQSVDGRRDEINLIGRTLLGMFAAPDEETRRGWALDYATQCDGYDDARLDVSSLLARMRAP